MTCVFLGYQVLLSLGLLLVVRVILATAAWMRTHEAEFSTQTVLDSYFPAMPSIDRTLIRYWEGDSRLKPDWSDCHCILRALWITPASVSELKGANLVPRWLLRKGFLTLACQLSTQVCTCVPHVLTCSRPTVVWSERPSVRALHAENMLIASQRNVVSANYQGSGFLPSSCNLTFFCRNLVPGIGKET